MRNRLSPPSPSAATVNSAAVANALAAIARDQPEIPVVTVDRSASPPGGTCHVRLPDCRSCPYAHRRPPVRLLDDDSHMFTDLVESAGNMTLPELEHSSRNSWPGMPDARAFIDKVEGGPARTVEPGYADIAGIACPYLRADTMLALGWVTPLCACLEILLKSLPDDTVTGVYVKSSVIASPTKGLEDPARDEERQRQKSADWAAYLRWKLEGRRPAAGDLFANFGLRPDGSDLATALQPTRGSRRNGHADGPDDETPPWDEDPVDPTANTLN